MDEFDCATRECCVYEAFVEVETTLGEAGTRTAETTRELKLMDLLMSSSLHAAIQLV